MNDEANIGIKIIATTIPRTRERHKICLCVIVEENLNL